MRARRRSRCRRFLVRSGRGGVVEVAWRSSVNHHPVAVGTLRIAAARFGPALLRSSARLALAPRLICIARGKSEWKPRFVRESESEYSELALPNDANGFGNLLGGRIMHLVDLAGAIAAMKHCRNPVVTASVDHMDFIHPVKIGQLVRLRASVNRAFRTSMEAGREGVGGRSGDRRGEARLLRVI